MLVLSRRLNEFLVLNDDIFISVFEVAGDGTQVKIAIEAPKDVKIARSEVFEQADEIQQKLDSIRSRKITRGQRKRRKEAAKLAAEEAAPAAAE